MMIVLDDDERQTYLMMKFHDDDDDDDDDDLPAQIHIQRLLRQRRRSGSERKWTEKKIHILQRKENLNIAKKLKKKIYIF